MNIVKKKKMGRPPAMWLYEVVKITNQDGQLLDVAELSRLLGTSVMSLKSFLRKSETPKKHVVENGTAKAKYKMADIKKSVREYLIPWQ